MHERRRRGVDSPTSTEGALPVGAPGKRTQTQGLIQRRASGAPAAPGGEQALETADAGFAGAPQPLPHLDRIQESFGRHDVSGVEAHVGGPAAHATADLGALAYASGPRVAFAAAPDLHTAAHEAAHVVQQRGGVRLKGVIGEAGDEAEQHADAVADRVVAGDSAEALLDGAVGGAPVRRVQKRDARVAVATSVQANRTTYPGDDGGLLTQDLLKRLKSAKTSVADAAAASGAGDRKLGAKAKSGEERAGVSVGASATPAAGTTAEKRAVVIGNGEYDAGTTMGSCVEPSRPLPGSPVDAGKVASALKGRGYAVTSLTDQTAAGIESALTTALSGLTAGSELVFYYSGHGTPEGLIGRDGKAYTPAQMLGVRSAALAAKVDLVIATDACHAGIFADAVRGAELRDTKAAAAAAGSTTSTSIVSLIDAAIAVQDAKDGYNTKIWEWWQKRYKLEADAAAGGYSAAVMAPWTAHMDEAATVYNEFVAVAKPLLTTLGTTASAAGLTLGSLELTEAKKPFNGDEEARVQAGLDDVDTLTNQVLVFCDGKVT